MNRRGFLAVILGAAVVPAPKKKPQLVLPRRSRLFLGWHWSVPFPVANIRPYRGEVRW